MNDLDFKRKSLFPLPSHSMTKVIATISVHILFFHFIIGTNMVKKMKLFFKYVTSDIDTYVYMQTFDLSKCNPDAHTHNPQYILTLLALTLKIFLACPRKSPLNN